MSTKETVMTTTKMNFNIAQYTGCNIKLVKLSVEKIVDELLPFNKINKIVCGRVHRSARPWMVASRRNSMLMEKQLLLLAINDEAFLYQIEEAHQYTRMIYDVKVKKIFTFKNEKILEKIQNTYVKMGEGRYIDWEDEQSVLSMLHNIYIYNDTLCVNLNFTSRAYFLDDVSKMLSYINNCLTLYQKQEIQMKVSLNSPGEISLFIQNALQYIEENYLAVMLLAMTLFGGNITGEKFHIEFPSVKNVIEYAMNIKHERESKDLEIKSKEVQLEKEKLENEKIKLENELLELQILSQKNGLVVKNDKIVNFDDYLDE